jgi:enoyl-CoA hydratase/carnithine racemase
MSPNVLESAIKIDRDGSAVILRIDREHAGNALDCDTVEELRVALRSIAPDGARGIIIAGNGRFFCAGGDVKAYSLIETQEQLRKIFDTGRQLLDEIQAFPLPVIAAIDGYALGGGAELALACDLRVASSTASIGFPQCRLGIIPGWDGIERLVALIGPSDAMRILLSSERLSGADSKALGLVDVLAEGSAVNKAVALVEAFGDAPLSSIKACKTAVRAAASASRDVSRSVARDLFEALWFTAEHKEAERAFKEKRKPISKGRDEN